MQSLRGQVLLSGLCGESEDLTFFYELAPFHNLRKDTKFCQEAARLRTLMESSELWEMKPHNPKATNSGLRIHLECPHDFAHSGMDLLKYRVVCPVAGQPTCFFNYISQTKNHCKYKLHETFMSGAHLWQVAKESFIWFFFASRFARFANGSGDHLGAKELGNGKGCR